MQACWHVILNPTASHGSASSPTFSNHTFCALDREWRQYLGFKPELLPSLQVQILQNRNRNFFFTLKYNQHILQPVSFRNRNRIGRRLRSQRTWHVWAGKTTDFSWTEDRMLRENMVSGRLSLCVATCRHVCIWIYSDRSLGPECFGSRKMSADMRPSFISVTFPKCFQIVL